MDETQSTIHADTVLMVYNRSMDYNIKFAKIDCTPSTWQSIEKLGIQSILTKKISQDDVLLTIAQLHSSGELILIRDSVDQILYEFNVTQYGGVSDVVLYGKRIFSEYMSLPQSSDRSSYMSIHMNPFHIMNMIHEYIYAIDGVVPDVVHE
jgi:hypothetical protein